MHVDDESLRTSQRTSHRPSVASSSSFDSESHSVRRYSRPSGQPMNSVRTASREPAYQSRRPSLDSAGDRDVSMRSLGRRSLMTNIALDGGPSGQKRRTINWRRCLTHVCRDIVESRFFTLITTLLTLYALTGDDLRIALTNRPADIYFNVITLVCICIFTLEVILSCVGRDDYIFGFFFMLDIGSTATLMLDLTWVAYSYQDYEESSGNVEGSSSLVLGARVGRVVRIVRLVRIVKLYKAVYEAKQARKRRKRRQEKKGRLNDDDDWDDVDLNLLTTDPHQSESRVSKKLSELTTRRVILLVLTLMLALPWLRVDPFQQSASSAEYGADIVHQTFEEYREISSDSSNDVSATEHAQWEYTRALLTYIHYHNWYAQVDGCFGDDECARVWNSHVFWVGFVGRERSLLEEIVEQAELPKELVDRFIDEVEAQGRLIYGYSEIPAEVREALSLPWSEVCNVDSNSNTRRGISLIGKEISGKVFHDAPCPDDLRPNEVAKYSPRLLSPSQHATWHWAFYFDIRPFQRKDAWFSMAVTAYVCFVLCVAFVIFSSDADNLVLGPVEDMISKVYIIRENPMHAMKLADEEFKKEEKQKAEERRYKHKSWMVIRDWLFCHSCKETPPVSETVILEKTIIKLGSLLALGFGEAGAEIIAANMHGVDTSNVDVMKEGVHVWGIIGCARIRDFSAATEVLHKRIMTFVNQIAEIVHSVVDETHGAANKNNGDRFLLIWRIPAALPDEVIQWSEPLAAGDSSQQPPSPPPEPGSAKPVKRPEKSVDQVEPPSREQVSRYADLSMYAFARILGGIHRSPVLRVYRDHPGLQHKLGGNCRVNLSFGLHYGWAIEGAVGSEFKIDASYLSPNVSIAETIERATEVYNVNILVAESVHRMCTDEVGSSCRLIDNVKIVGSAEPMKLYVMDLNPLAMTVDPKPPARHFSLKLRFMVRQDLEAVKKKMLMADEVDVTKAFRAHPDIGIMKKMFTTEFLYTFKMGYQNYVEGEWQVAQRFLSKARALLARDDGPSRALLEYMEAYGFEVPAGWEGYRDLGVAWLP